MMILLLLLLDDDDVVVAERSEAVVVVVNASSSDSEDELRLYCGRCCNQPIMFFAAFYITVLRLDRRERSCGYIWITPSPKRSLFEIFDRTNQALILLLHRSFCEGER